MVAFVFSTMYVESAEGGSDDGAIVITAPFGR